MAGTVTIAETLLGPVRKVRWAWTCDASGNVSGAGGQTVKPFNGKLELLTTVPTDGPTANYDITVTDEDGVDVLAGAGANRHTTNTEQVLSSSLGAVATSRLTLNIANAGNAKSGVVYLYIR